MRVSAPVLTWLTELAEAFDEHRDRPEPGPATERRRRDLLDRVGLAFERYRTVIADLVESTDRALALLNGLTPRAIANGLGANSDKQQWEESK